MTTPTQHLLVFTDLDGTLLDHDTYSFQAALPALERLRQNDIPVILTTSKTWAEVRDLQEELDLKDPCIVENGSAVFNGSSQFSQEVIKAEEQVFGQSYDSILNWINMLPQQLRTSIRGFGDMSVSDVGEATGLSLSKAKKAKERLASEPFLWTGSQEGLEQLKALLKKNDMGLLQGGRFYHILSKVDKSLALQWLIDQACAAYPQKKFHSCALGDGPNDAQMIAGADTGVVIANPKGIAIDLPVSHGQIVRTDLIGPAGWNAALNELMDQLGYR